MNKLKFNDLNIKNYTNSLSIYKISPPLPLRGNVGQLKRGRECFVGLSVLLAYAGHCRWVTKGNTVIL